MAAKKRRKPKLDTIIDHLYRVRPKAGQQCRVCASKIAKDLLSRYFERMDDGDDVPSLWFMSQYMERELRISKTSVYGHVNKCLQRPTSRR